MILLKNIIMNFKNYLLTTEKSNETIKSYSSDLSSFEKFLERKYNCPLYIDELQSNDIEEYLYHLKKKNLQTATRNRNLYTLRSFWNYAYKNKFCKWNIASSIEPVKVQNKERTYLTLDEASELIAAIDHPLISLVIQTLFYTGMRINECLNLKLNNINLENGIIHILGGKGNKNRDIPINHTLLPLLKNYFCCERPKVSSDFFFATKKSGGLSAAYVNSVLNDTVRKLGWNKHVTAHILRHSFASNLIKKGVNLVYVQKLLGHSNLKVTSIYTHADMDELSKSVNML